MDIRGKPMDTKSGLCWCCFGCRRRSLTSKLTPIILQVIVVTVIWFVIRKTCYTPSQDADITARAISSSEDQEVPMCDQGEYIKGSSLLIQDIVSVSGSLDAKEGQKRFFLQVDILTRNADQEKPILYTVGTPVIMSGLFSDKEENTGGNNLSDKEKAEFYYDNSIDEKDMDQFINDGIEEGKEETQDGSLNEFSDDGHGDDTNNGVVDIQSNINNLSGKVSSSVLQNGQGNIVVGVGSQQTFQNIKHDNQQNNINPVVGQGVNSPPIQMPQMNVQPQVLQQKQSGIPNSLVQNSNNQQIQPGQLNFQQNPSQQSFEEANKVEAKPIVQQVYQGNSINVQEQQSNNINYHAQKFTANQTNLNHVNPLVNNDQNTGDVVMDQTQGNAQSENVQTDGFLERLMRFKTEFYGRAVGESVDQTATSYAINDPSRCESLDKVDVLFLINTIPQSNEQRQRIRDTFVDAALFQPFAISHVFLVGLTSSPNFQGNLEKEQEEYGDIVQGEFSDKPETKTLKGLMGFRWVTSFCSKAQFIFKLDEDVFVDTEKLLRGLIPTIVNVINDKSILCFFVQNAPIPRSGPNAFDQNLFPKSSRMRPYCKGFAVLTTVSTISSLVTASEHVPFFQFDDLYLYGILPFVAGGIDVYDLGNKRAFHDFGMAVVNCYKELQDKCPYVATKAFSSRFTSLWEFVTARTSRETPKFEGDPSLWTIASFKSTFYS